MIKPNPKNGTGSKLELILRIRYSEMAIPSRKEVLDQGLKLTLAQGKLQSPRASYFLA